MTIYELLLYILESLFLPFNAIFATKKKQIHHTIGDKSKVTATNKHLASPASNLAVQANSW